MSTAPRSSLIPAAAVLIGGVLMAVQSRANGTLSVALGDPFLTAIWSIASGWVLLLPVMASRRARAAFARLRAAYAARQLPWWMFLGGLVGGLLVSTQAWAVPLAGVALVTIAIVAGQTLGALWVDHIGLGPGGAKVVTPGRVAAAVTTLLGVALVVWPRLHADGAHVLAPALLALAVGALLAGQTATNGRVNATGGNPLVTTWNNFSWGLVVVLSVGAAQLLRGATHLPAGVAAPWWAWTGGVLGLVYVGINAVAVRRVGVLLVMLLAVTGQLIGALLLDLVDPVQRAHVGVGTVAGILITLGACVAAGLAGRRSRRRP